MMLACHMLKEYRNERGQYTDYFTNHPQNICMSECIFLAYVSFMTDMLCNIQIGTDISIILAGLMQELKF